MEACAFLGLGCLWCSGFKVLTHVVLITGVPSTISGKYPNGTVGTIHGSAKSNPFSGFHPSCIAFLSMSNCTSWHGLISQHLPNAYAWGCLPYVAGYRLLLRGSINEHTDGVHIFTCTCAVLDLPASARLKTQDFRRLNSQSEAALELIAVCTGYDSCDFALSSHRKLISAWAARLSQPSPKCIQHVISSLQNTSKPTAWNNAVQITRQSRWDAAFAHFASIMALQNYVIELHNWEIATISAHNAQRVLCFARE